MSKPLTTRTPRPCKLCRRLTKNLNGYCDSHQDRYKPNEARKVYDKQRGSPSSRGYDHSWVKLRAEFMREHPLCELCEKKGLIVLAEEVHHIKPIADGGARLDKRNLQALCKACHTKITNEAGQTVCEYSWKSVPSKSPMEGVSEVPDTKLF